jgi:hypothetical protein
MFDDQSNVFVFVRFVIVTVSVPFVKVPFWGGSTVSPIQFRPGPRSPQVWFAVSVIRMGVTSGAAEVREGEPM